MYEPQINYFAVLTATLAHYILGALWYSPALFSKQWINAMGLSKSKMENMEKGGQGKKLALQFLGTLILVFVTAHMVDFMKVVYPDLGALQVGLTSAL